MSWKLLLLIREILFTEYAQFTQPVHVSDEWTFKHVLLVEHNARENFQVTCFKIWFNHSVTALTTGHQACSLRSVSACKFFFYITHRSILILCVCARVCVFAFLIRIGDKYVIHWLRLSLRFWALVLRTECTAFPHTDIKLNEMFSKITLMIEGE